MKATQDLITESENHYYYEEKALQLNFSVLNTGSHPVDDLHIEFGFPKTRRFRHCRPNPHEPVRQELAPGDPEQGLPGQWSTPGMESSCATRSVCWNRLSPTPALRCPIRMAVGPGMQKRKIAVLYTLRRGDEVISEGRLKIKFGEVVD